MAVGVAKAVICRKVAAAPGEFDFSTLGLSSNLDARAGVTVTGVGVSTWDDQGTANLNGTQNTDSFRPTTGGAVNGFAALVFTTADVKRLNWALTSASAGTIFVVGQVGAQPDSNSDSILGSGAGSASGDAGISIQHDIDGVIRIRISDGTTRVNVGTGTRAAGANFIIGIRWSATQMGVRINGNAEQTGTPPGAGSGAFGSATYDIGKTEGVTPSWDGEITRILAAPTTRLNDTNFASAFTELNGIYGIY